MYHLICVTPFDNHKTGKKYAKGMIVTDTDEVKALSFDREHHFIRIAAPMPVEDLSAPVKSKKETI